MNGQQICVGNIISPTKILTDAECVKTYQKSNLTSVDICVEVNRRHQKKSYKIKSMKIHGENKEGIAILTVSSNTKTH